MSMERKCSNCINCEYRDDGGRLATDTCIKCKWVKVGKDKVPSNWKAKPKTNADRIRALSDEELAEVLGKIVHCGGCPMRDNCKVDNLPCNNVLLEWLKQPAEEE